MGKKSNVRNPGLKNKWTIGTHTTAVIRMRSPVDAEWRIQLALARLLDTLGEAEQKEIWDYLDRPEAGPNLARDLRDPDTEVKDE